MNLLVRVGFMIRVSLFYKDSSAQGRITDLGTPPKKCFADLWLHLVAMPCYVSKCFPLEFEVERLGERKPQRWFSEQAWQRTELANAVLGT